MNSNTDIRGRRSIRLKEFDYSRPGAYFVTICTNRRQCLFGDIVDEEMMMNEYGRVVQTCWNEIPVHYSNTQTDDFVVMPNHIHGIILLNDCNVGAGLQPALRAGLKPAPTRDKRHGLPEIVRGLKTFSSKQINEIRKSSGVQVWQRNYYEHVIRNETELESVRRYIKENPLKWDIDPENPGAGATGGSPVHEEP